MKLALITARPKIADPLANIRIIENSIKKTSADLYVFGELFLSGYHCKDELRTLAEPLDGPSIKKIKRITRERHCSILFGMPLRDEKIKGVNYNAAILVQADGTVEYYKKWFLPNFGPFEEKIFFDEGEELPVFSTPWGKIGVFICYDLFFPEVAKALSLQGADVLICLSATPSTTRVFFETLIPARAVENTVFMVYVNLVGTQDDLVFWGGSQVYDPLGKLVVKAPYFKESIVTCDLDLTLLDVARLNRPVLRDIRPQIYEDLYSMSRFHRKKKKSSTR
ncbi:MAG: carbon-nitrogen hydrolase family protein [Methanobacteriota archaeon]